MSPFRGIPVPFLGAPSIAPQYLAGVKKRKEIYERLCAAARDFLCLELEEQIERAEHLISVFAPEPKGRPVAVVVPLADSAASTAPMSPGAAPADPSTSTNSGDQTKGIA